APPGESVEDLDRDAVFEALRGKVPYASLADAADLRAAAGDEEATDGDEPSGSVARVGDGGAVRSGGSEDGSAGASVPSAASPEVGSRDGATEPDDADAAAERDDDGTQASVGPDADADDDPAVNAVDEADAAVETDEADDESVGADEADEADATADSDEPDEARSIAAHVSEVVDEGTGRARLLGDEFDVLDEVEAADAFDAVEGADAAPHAVVVDGTVDQRLLDVAAQRGVGDVVGRDLGEFVKRPVGTRVLAADDVWAGS
ncbi:DNA primase, partial [Halorubrum sp. SD612]